MLTTSLLKLLALISRDRKSLRLLFRLAIEIVIVIAILKIQRNLNRLRNRDFEKKVIVIVITKIKNFDYISNFYEEIYHQNYYCFLKLMILFCS